MKPNDRTTSRSSNIQKIQTYATNVYGHASACTKPNAGPVSHSLTLNPAPPSNLRLRYATENVAVHFAPQIERLTLHDSRQSPNLTHVGRYATERVGAFRTREDERSTYITLDEYSNPKRA
jgi:hypothetical protein